MARQGSVWHGTQAELGDLLSALERHCTCQKQPDGQILSVCGPHRLLSEGQRELDGLVMVRRLRARLLAEEWSGPTWEERHA